MDLVGEDFILNEVDLTWEAFAIWSESSLIFLSQAAKLASRVTCSELQWFACFADLVASCWPDSRANRHTSSSAYTKQVVVMLFRQWLRV